MDIMIQDPTYASSMRLGEALIDACKKSVDGVGAFAFAEENGIELFLGDSEYSNFIKNHKYELVIGTDSITDSRAVERLRAYCELYSNLTVYGYVHDSRKNLFHPKMTLFETDDGGLSIIGSGNLTERGLYHNVEMYAYNLLDKDDFKKIKTSWQMWLNYSITNNFVFDINDPIIDHAVNLSTVKKIRSFSNQWISDKTHKKIDANITPELFALYKKQPRNMSVKLKDKILPDNEKVKPQMATKIIETDISAVAPIDAIQLVNPVWKVSLLDRVLIAEVPKAGKRWKQINFDKESFKNFFGATPGEKGGTYRILLKNVNDKGELLETESRPSVSVASHNWRFEINAATGLPYPNGGNRPYVIFAEVSTRSFVYELLMPEDVEYTEVDEYIKSWKRENGVKGIARIVTNVNDLKKKTPNLSLWKVEK